MTKKLIQAKRLIHKAKMSNSLHLDLSGLGLEEIPKEILSVKHITSINLSNNQISSLPIYFDELTNLEEVFYEATPIEFSEWEGYILAMLKINHAIKNNINELDLRGLQLESLPSTILKINNLKRIDISENRFYSIPKELFHFTNLIDVEIDSSHILEGDAELFAFTLVNEARINSSAELDLSQLKLRKLPSGIEKLTTLTKLDLYENQLEFIDERVLMLSNLKTLDISGNRLLSIPSNIDKLTNLESLYLNGNLLEQVPKELGKLKNLRVLCLGSNRLKALPDEFSNLVRLNTLDICDNSLYYIPENFTKLKRLKELDISGNDFKILNEVYDRSPDEVIKYIIELHKAKRPLHEAKVIFIGSGFVGKTSLINMLTLNKMGKPEKTDGIDIKRWNIDVDGNSIRLNIWDFGGQEIMHATHKFFMTSRSVYVVVTNPRIEDKYGDSELEYWIKLIHSYAGKVSTPIIVVINKCETHKVDIATETLKSKYPNIIDFIETSCVENIGIDTLNNLIKTSIKNIKGVSDELPYSYFLVKEELEKTNRDYIQYNDYIKICKSIDSNFDDANVRGLVRILHDLGTMLTFADDRKLYETQVLNPEWVTNGVYQIITSPVLIKKKGVMTYEEIEYILDSKKYPTPKERSYILDIMERFELSYQVESKKDSFFIPGGFPKDPPKVKWEKKATENLRFVYSYDVLPSSIMSRFMVKIHRLICGSFYWRNGVVITHNDCFALIKADIEEKKIYIEVEGATRKRATLSMIMEMFNSIHDVYHGLEIERYIPFVSAKSEVLINYDDLLKYEEAEEELIFIPSTKERLKVSLLLEGIIGPRNKDSLIKGKKVFLSYSHEDEKLKSRLLIHLKSLERLGLVSVWHDRMIKPGSNQEIEIYKNLSDSFLIILLISPDFIASDFCYSREMKYALESHSNRDQIVVPVILRPCNWVETPIGDIQALPKDSVPITVWANEDLAFHSVVRGIQSLFEERENYFVRE